MPCRKLLVRLSVMHIIEAEGGEVWFYPRAVLSRHNAGSSAQGKKSCHGLVRMALS